MWSPAPAEPTAAEAWPSSGFDPEVNFRLLDEMTWGFRTRGLRALRFDFAVRTSDRTVGRYLGHLLHAFERAGRPSHIYSLIDGERTPDGRYELYRDGEQVSVTSSASTVLRHLLWDVNRNVVEQTKDLLLVHASAVAISDGAIVFPAPMGYGKTTLVTGLLRTGLRYVTDEAVALDPDTLAIVPYPKPLAIESGSWPVLSDLRPEVVPSLEPFLEAGWYVPPSAIGGDIVALPSGPRFVIAPRYERGRASELVGMSRSEALITLAENCFNITSFGARRSLDILARVVRASDCYRLTVGDLADACALVHGVLGMMPGNEDQA